MSKLTREQRLAAGWEEWFFVRLEEANTRKPSKNYDICGHDREHPTLGALYRTRESATRRALSFNPACRARVVILWRRKKPKAPPPLKVGDEVMVRAIVVRPVDDDGDVPIRMLLHGGTYDVSWVREEDIVR